jgi:hypothetical protein
VNNGLSRLIETRADVASLEATRDPATFAKMQRELDLRSLSDNGPAWSHFWFGSHPTTLERIAIAEQLGRRMGAAPYSLSPPNDNGRGSPMDPRPSARRGLDVAESASPRVARARSHALAGALEKMAENGAAEGEHRNDDQRRDAGDEQAVLDGRGAALVGPDATGREQDAQVVEH